MMKYLIKAYGQIKPEELRSIKTEVEEYIYDPLPLIKVLFNKLEFFAALTQFAGKPFHNSHKVDIIYIILNHCDVFQNSLKA